MAGELWTVNLGVVEYREAWALQERVRAARQADAIPDTLLLLEHPPVYTRGRRSTPGELAMGEDWYRMQGIDIVDVDRGGLLTYHGPGQLVGYPIMRVADLMGYVRTMEQAIVTALVEEGVPAPRGRSGDGRDFIGVWTAERKIASIGVHRSREVTTHGFAVNVDNDLQPFEWVVPCGLPDVRMTSVTRELGHRRPPAVLSQAHGLPLRRGLRPPPAAGVGGAPGGGGRRRAGPGMTFVELGVDDADRGRAFYEGVFGWTFEPGPSGNGYMIHTPDGRAGIHGGDAGASPYVFFAVEDIDAAMERVRELGGTVEDMDVEGDEESQAEHGRFKLCRDDQGSPFGLHQPPARRGPPDA